MKFLVVTSAPTIQQNNYFTSYAPYVKEMDIWFKNVDKVGILSPIFYPEKVFLEKFERQDLKLFRMPFFSFRTWNELFYYLFYFPKTLYIFIQAFIWADHIHLRCPGNFGLMGAVTQMFFPWKPKTVKYAGNWNPLANQPRSYKLQKWILSNTLLTRNMTVLVYGKWPDQSKNILPFFTASFAESEIEEIEKDFRSPYKFLFVGNLVEGKQPLIAVQFVEALNKRGIPIELHIYGDGILKIDLEKEAENKGYIYLHGNQPLEVLKQAYKESTFLILPSKSEGWPKAVAEAMFFGCIPIATVVSCVPWMLGAGSRGILLPDGEKRAKRIENRSTGRGVDEKGWVEESADKIIELIEDPEEMKRMSLEAQDWSQEYTLEKFEEAIKKVLASQPPKGE